MEEKEKGYLYWLVCLPFLGAVSIRKLYEYFQSFERIYNMEETELAQSGALKPAQMRKLMENKSRYPECLEEYLSLEGRGIDCVTFLDGQYPGRLLEVYDYPMMLFVKGQVPSDAAPSVAVVGARGCSAYGEQLTQEFARQLASEGVQIISGLAIGIDGAAHRGALQAGGGKTFGILGCGIDICYPMQNYGLYEKMQQEGGVLSEFPVGRGPLRQHFPMRNRIISGLADAVLVAEAKERSGSLITAESGLEQGREIFAVPGRVTDQLSAGCNQLIAQGAHLASSPDDILEYLGIKHKKKLVIHEKNVKSLAKKEKMVYSFLDFNPKHVDEIAADTGFSAIECLEILWELELGGYVLRSSGQYFGRKLYPRA